MYNKPRLNVKDLNTEVIIRAPDLYNEYSNAVKTADGKYLDKIIKVTGKVQHVYKTDSTMSVQLSANNLLNDINCSLAMDGNKNFDLPAIGK